MRCPANSSGCGNFKKENMRTNRTIAGWLMLARLLSLNLSTAYAQGTAFSYQGKLNDHGNPAAGIYDLRFTIYDAATNGDVVSGVLTNAATPVTNGLFAVTLDFGSGVFTGPARWLELDVRTNGGGSFTSLQPLQPLLPMPYAIMANSASNLLGTLPAAQLIGTLPSGVLAGYSGSVTLTNGGNSFNGSFSGSFGGSGAGLTGVPGTLAWQNVTGTSQQAQPNIGYLANNAAPVTITLPASPNLGDIVRVSGVGTGGWIIAQNAGQAIQATAFGINYTNRNILTNWTQTSAPNENWYSIASSADGTKLAAVAYNGGIYVSTDSGLIWALTSAPDTNLWTSIASSSDGSKLAAVGYNAVICTSTNAGATWSQSGNVGMMGGNGFPWWLCIASSADGTKLAAGAQTGPAQLFISSNSGVSLGNGRHTLWVLALHRLLGGWH